MRQTSSSLADSRRGVAVIEFALVLPLLALLALGILGYGQYFLLAHSVQQIANDAARATIGGLSAAERVALANGTVARELGQMPAVQPGQMSVAVEDAGELTIVRLRLDAATHGLFAARIVPMPDPVIERRATVRQGGIE
ncbi:pilus assembly protein [Sphingomonas sp. NBWT7]|uniref:TadE/TadG family type IV pilus assembly protein n=1 Tax=Sphingomonas sp. NBWT7 TaxID=2596913 RepID=UPI0016237AAF|nr:TadE/TadG family type IV pilus assembly protein [Sphingomonas sp. NBWT7]QNE31817.1 pilus assembly protein [Sphingomonas sp. NBWT7]